jgi:hypothetical protein
MTMTQTSNLLIVSPIPTFATESVVVNERAESWKDSCLFTNHILFKASVAITLLLAMEGCGPIASTEKNETGLRTLQLTTEKSNKLLFCAGNLRGEEYAKVRGERYTQENENWFTVDRAPEILPDYVANLMEEESYKRLPQNQFETIVDEHCPFWVSDEIGAYASGLLKHNGVLVSHVCAPFEELEKVRNSLLSGGFAEVLFASDEIDSWKGSHWQKRLNNEEIVKEYKKFELEGRNPDKCGSRVKEDSRWFKTGADAQWYQFVAVKG